MSVPKTSILSLSSDILLDIFDLEVLTTDDLKNFRLVNSVFREIVAERLFQKLCLEFVELPREESNGIQLTSDAEVGRLNDIIKNPQSSALRHVRELSIQVKTMKSVFAKFAKETIRPLSALFESLKELNVDCTEIFHSKDAASAKADVRGTIGLVFEALCERFRKGMTVEHLLYSGCERFVPYLEPLESLQVLQVALWSEGIRDSTVPFTDRDEVIPAAMESLARILCNNAELEDVSLSYRNNSWKDESFHPEGEQVLEVPDFILARVPEGRILPIKILKIGPWIHFPTEVKNLRKLRKLEKIGYDSNYIRDEDQRLIWKGLKDAAVHLKTIKDTASTQEFFDYLADQTGVTELTMDSKREPGGPEENQKIYQLFTTTIMPNIRATLSTLTLIIYPNIYHGEPEILSPLFPSSERFAALQGDGNGEEGGRFYGPERFENEEKTGYQSKTFADLMNLLRGCIALQELTLRVPQPGMYGNWHGWFRWQVMPRTWEAANDGNEMAPWKNSMALKLKYSARARKGFGVRNWVGEWTLQLVDDVWKFNLARDGERWLEPHAPRWR